MSSNSKKLIAVIGATGLQGGAVDSSKSRRRVFAKLFPGAAEIAATFAWFQAHTYLGSDSRVRIALANKVAGRQPTTFSTWARANFPVHASA